MTEETQVRKLSPLFSMLTSIHPLRRVARQRHVRGTRHGLDKSIRPYYDVLDLLERSERLRRDALPCHVCRDMALSAPPPWTKSWRGTSVSPVTGRGATQSPEAVKKSVSRGGPCGRPGATTRVAPTTPRCNAIFSHLPTGGTPSLRKATLRGWRQTPPEGGPCLIRGQYVKMGKEPATSAATGRSQR